MSFISWNIRGLGGLNKITLVRMVVDLHELVVLCLHETKMEVHDTRTTRVVGGSSIDKWVSLPAIGFSRVILLG